ncbi:MAG: pyrroline-5-carboxylate reductase [Granulosicoccus sp.]
MHWLFIGAGNMASSLIGGLVGSGANPQSIRVHDTRSAACQRLIDQFGVSGNTDLEPLLTNPVDGSELGIVIAVKPDIVETVCAAISHSLSNSTTNPLVVSVAAGVTTGSLQHWLPNRSPIVRCMPNTPALLGLGATALFASEHTSAEHYRVADALLSTAGITVRVDQESLLDAVTAVSGSGPAYIFHLVELMAAAATQLGLDKDTATTLAIETAFGAASMLRQGHDDPATLRKNVTSAGGTTAAALAVFADAEFPAIVMQALQASHDRAIEMGNGLAPDNKTQ